MTTIDPKDPDASLVALFRHSAIQNEAKSVKEGRPIFDDVEICEIRIPGSRDVKVFPATAVSHWVEDQFTGGQTKITYAERFSRQYRQFKEHTAQTKSGTPLSYLPFLTEARRAELQAQNIYTAEALAEIDGQPLRNLGHGGREMKNKAMEYLADAKLNASSTQLVAELEALRARNQILEDDLAAAKKNGNGHAADFDDMSDEHLRDFIRTQTGHTPQGNLNRKTLLRMAMDARPSKAA